MSRVTFINISDLFTALAAEFLGLADSTSHAEMTGSQYIAELDRPDVGEGNPPLITNTPAEVFNNPATVFAAPVAGPIYTMLPAAGEFSREALLNAGTGWTDELLVANNMMTITFPNVAPTPPAAPPTPPAAPAPPAPPVAPTPPAGVTSTPGAIELDAAGLPWDARIHSGGRTKKANGQWVARKGVDAGIVAQVTAELRQNPPKGNAPFVPPPAAHAPLAQSAAGAPPNPAPAPPALAAGLTKEQQLAKMQADASLAAAIAAAPKPPADGGPVPTDAKSLMEWVSMNGYGPHMTTVAQMLGLAGFGLMLQPENAKHIGTAYQTFLALGKPAPAA